MFNYALLPAPGFFRRFEVPHRDFLAVTSRTIVVIDDKDVSHTISPLHVVFIEDPVQAK